MDAHIAPERLDETASVIGRGFLRMRSQQDTLLHHQGLTRPPEDVFKILPSVFHDYKSRALRLWANLKSLGLRGLIPLQTGQIGKSQPQTYSPVLSMRPD